MRREDDWTGRNDGGERPLLASRRQALIESARLVGGALLLSVGVASVTPDGGQSVAFAQAMPTGGVDPQMQEVLDALAALDPLPLETVIPRQARELPSVADAVQGALAARGQPPAVEPVGQIEHRLIPGGPGSEGTLVRIYTPASGAGPFPVLVYFHGGGWVIANLNVYDASARALANAATAVVVSVAYRQAPENPFPAAVDDAYAAYQWVVGNAATFNGDSAHVAVGGESAGGNLAAVTALLAHQRGLAPPLHQMLVYPVTDFVGDYPSYQENFDAKPLSTPALQWFGRYYLRSDADRQDPRASPLRAPDLHGLPSATVILAEIDPLRDQGAAYATRLREAGVPVTARLYQSVTHEFFGTGAVVDQAKDAVAVAAAGLRAAFAAGPSVK